MDRLSQQCPGDCSRCQLLAEGHVDMVPCAIDQLMQRSARQAAQLQAIQNALAASPAALASNTPQETAL